ncbi:MAG TPA: hypothetical protein PLB78_15840, partial [Anaerolineae bacterium]|nr:hypothetical protein [Anaerolineae bacterium]
LPVGTVATQLQLPRGRDADGHMAYVYKGPCQHVWVRLYEYRITGDCAWLPEHHSYVGKLGTRVQMRAEAYLDLLSFRIYLHGRIERKYQVPGQNRWL